MSASVPFLTGTTATEMTFFAPDDQLRPIDAATFAQRVEGLLKVDDAEADRLIALYRKQQPGRDNIDLSSVWRPTARASASASRRRRSARPRSAARRSTCIASSTTRRSASGRLKSMHCMEIPFVFDNLEAGKMYTGISPAAQRIADQMSAAWVAFARTGNPNHRGIPDWTAFNTTQRPTMVFGDETRLVNDPGREERLALKAIRDRLAKPV